MAAEVRQDLVEEARKFLSSPKVITEKDENKRAFLLKKGLSDDEINMAFSMVPNIIIDSGASSQVPGLPVPYIHQQPTSRWTQIRDFANLMIILSGGFYGIHYVYKCYIGPLLTGRREKSAEDRMIELQQSVVTILNDVQSTLSSMEQTLSTQTNKIQTLNIEKTSDAATKRQLDELKTEITSLKGLLVNKRSFPASPSLSAGIPSWQLSNASNIISNSTVNNTSSIAGSLANGGSINGPTEATILTNGLNAQTETTIQTNGLNAATESISVTNGLHGPTESITVTNGLNVDSNITNSDDNSSTENGFVEDDSVVKEDVTNASSISSTIDNETHDTQVTAKNTEPESEKDQMISHNDVIKTDFENTSAKRETTEDTIITDSSDEISQ